MPSPWARTALAAKAKGCVPKVDAAGVAPLPTGVATGRGLIPTVDVTAAGSAIGEVMGVALPVGGAEWSTRPTAEITGRVA